MVIGVRKMRTALFKKNFLLTVILFFCISSFPVLSQDNTELQPVRFSWPEDEYALRYEVVIEKEVDGRYLALLREFTSASFAEFSLGPGQYRCQVIPYDFLEMRGDESPWVFFEVLAAPIPEPIPEPALVPESIPESVPEPAPVPELFPEPAATITNEEKAPEAELFNPINFYLSAAWMPLLPIYDDDNQFFARNPSLIGAGIRFGVLYSSPLNLNIGLEAAASWYAFNADSAFHHAVNAGLNLLVQKRRPDDKTALNYRLGAGLTLLEGRKCLHASLGLSFLIFPQEHFFLEAGLEYTHLFLSLPSGYFRPMLGLGLKF